MLSIPRVNCLKAKNAEYLNGYCLTLSWQHWINFFDPLQKPTFELFERVIGLTEFATLSAGDRVKMVVKCIVGLFWGTHFQHGGKFVKTVPQCTLTTNSTRSSAQPQSGEYDMLTNETFRVNKERYGHSRIKERRYDGCSSSYSGIYSLCGIISKLAL